MMVPGHGRQYYRLAGLTRSQPENDEIGWPIGLEDLSVWYGHVEDRLQLKGGAHEPARLETSRLSEVLEPTAAENAVMNKIRSRWPEARPVIGSYGAPVQWLDLADRTGNLRLHTGAVVRRILKNETGGAAGVEWIDAVTGQVRNAFAPVVFLCASAIETTRILLMSRSDPNGPAIGTNSSALGCYLMDHAVMSGNGYNRAGFRSKAGDPAPDHSEPGRCIYLPPDASIHGSMGFQIHVHPRPDGSARVDIVSFAEMMPDPWNRVRLDPSKVDRYGMPVPVIRFQFSAAQQQMARRQADTIRQIAEDLELTDFQVNSELSPGGASIHECGTARMGADPETSVVDPNNECWDIKGLYVTDGACFPRQHVHNPTLTIMALTARAAAHAAASLTKTPDLAA
jgi:choline dehydrogenase-like flavoprotein